MKNRLLIAMVSLSLPFSMVSCASGPNAQRGALIGGLGGAALGGLIGSRSGDALEGALIGGGLGGLAGNWIGDSYDRRYYRRY